MCVRVPVDACVVSVQLSNIFSGHTGIRTRRRSGCRRCSEYAGIVDHCEFRAQVKKVLARRAAEIVAGLSTERSLGLQFLHVG